MSGPHVYNIQSCYPFAQTLAQYLMAQVADKPEELTQYKILLPTRRTCRVLRETFLSLNEGKPMLLPQMMALGDVEEDDLSLMMFGQTDDVLDIPPGINSLKRQLLLAQLISQVPSFQQGFDQALELAKALAKFIDQVIIEGLDFSDLHKIVPDEFAAHWQLTLSFLKIISEAWPAILLDNGEVDMAHRRNLLLQALAQYWAENPPSTPLIAAGSTGSIPAASSVLKVIADVQTGMVILPGLDTMMSNAAWNDIAESHPQHSLKNLLASLHVQRDDVQNITGSNHSEFQSGRHHLASSLMLPATMTGQWSDFNEQHDMEEMLNGLEYYVGDTQQEEAQIISLIMRETLENQNKVTALVTPDRGLARRVKNICRRWGVEVDDSAGEKLTDTQLGKLFLLILDMLKTPFDPVPLLACLKLPLCHLGFSKEDIKAFIKILEGDVLRSELSLGSYEKLFRSVEETEELMTLHEFMKTFTELTLPLRDMAQSNEYFPFIDILKTHIHLMESFAKTPELDGSATLWLGDIGKAGSVFLAQLLDHAHLMRDVTYDQYTNIIQTLIRDVTIRVPYGLHPRLLILGQLEARLIKADTIILGGLNEGVWPEDTKHDPWMSRPMRRDFGLPAMEQVIGFAAHDFVQGFCAQRVVMTRSLKVSGVPTLPSRWLERLDTLFQASGRTLEILNKTSYREWAQNVDMVSIPAPCERPKPCPPMSVRPNGISVTKVETWLKDPYAIYMHYVLKLRKIRPLKQDNDAALRGILLHSIFYEFMKAHPHDIPENAENIFLDIARDVIIDTTSNQDILDLWWPRLVEIAQWFVNYQNDWNNVARFVTGEVKGNLDIMIDDIPFNIYGVADRIDKLDQGYALIDYKSGGTFTKSKLQSGEYPQLPLEAMILDANGFDGRGFKHTGAADADATGIQGKTRYAGYWIVKGGRSPADITEMKSDVMQAAEVVRSGLEKLVRTFRDPETPFYCLPNAYNLPRFNDYKHVARVKEWSAVDTDLGEVG